ncbi:MAG: methyltransferase, partial [Clostridiales bacterium]|nr:methyltransferase [Clostridiales bacterium]
EEKYLSTMNDVNTSTKDTIIDYSVGTRIVDVGSGGGVLLDRLEKKFPDREIIGTDISSNVIDALNAKKKKEGHQWNVVVHNFVEGTFAENADTVIFSSILHEIYSYTETPNGRFEIESVKAAIKNACKSLNPGGRIIIRDGIKTDGSELVTIRFKDSDGMDFFNNYRNDFKGLKDIPDNRKVVSTDADNLTVTGDINFMREFMYTYTWGKQSYAHEVQEQFGYFTLKEYTDFLESIGAKIVVARELLESGYPLNLGKYLDLSDSNGNERVYPASNCIIVAEF